ncbi:MAG: hypothetical protein D6689_19185 [Deltaproteobacteria bacterium]|nr:MAG: hypothetical protein D6689_19185 [Deltaproteobacteria bacterium]
MTAGDDAVASYLRAARRARRRRLRRTAAAFGAGGAACVALAAAMTDVGHAVGFAATGAGLWVGAAVVLRAGRA